MIRYKLRREREGGFLLDGRGGTARRLSQSQYDFLIGFQAAPGQAGWPQAGIERHFAADVGAGQRWWADLVALGLTDLDGLRALQVISPAVELAALPGDCLAAPTRVYFELTRRCNLACHTCFNDSHDPLANELSLEEIMNGIEQLDQLGTFEIRFTGGEPTEHPSFRQIVDSSKSRGFHVSIGTNGVFSHEKRSWVYDSGVDWFIISLDGDEQTNDRVRGRGTYRSVLVTLRDLASRPHLRTRLNMVVGRHNVHTIESLARLADENNVESLNMIPLRPYGRSVETMRDTLFTQQEFYDFIRLIQKLRQRYRVRFITTLDLLNPQPTTSQDPMVRKENTCAAGVEAAVIGASGDVYGCSYSPASFPDSPDIQGRELFVAGNLRQDSLRSIWLDSRRWKVFRSLDTCKDPRCQTCAHYRVRCVGSCPIMGYYQEGRPAACDPYCFVDMLSTSEHHRAR